MENKITEAEFSGITESMLPDIITGQVREIQSLEISIKNAVAKAEEAKALAASAKERSAGLFQKKEAIELLQSATISLAEAESATVEAQRISFECQKKIGEITKYLFALGCTNMAANRSVVRELKLILEGASVTQLDELARQEVLNVVRQLKAQEDIINKQNELAGTLREQERLLSGQIEISGRAMVILKDQSVKSERVESELIELKKKNAELTERLQVTETELFRKGQLLKITVASVLTSGAALILAIIGLFL